MALWEIRLFNQGPIRVDVDDTRNLSEEYESLNELCASQRWSFWKRARQYWRVCEDMVIHRELVAGVFLKKPKPGRAVIGFESGES